MTSSLPARLSALLLVAVVGCSKTAPDAAPSDAALAARADAGVAVSAASAAPAAPAAPAGRARHVTGTYTLEPAKLYIPDHKDWSAVKQAKSDDASLVGPGTFTIDVDAAGKVTGKVEDGPAKGAVLDGSLDGTHLRATLRRDELADAGLTGVLEASLDDGKGELRLANVDASVVRKGAVTLTAK